MTSLFDKWNLRPGERRLVVVVAVVVFIVANLVFVLPKFGDWGRNERRIKEASDKLKTFRDEISLVDSNTQRLKILASQGGYVASEERDLAMQRDVTSQAISDQVQLTRTDSSRAPVSGRTNSFFEEQALVVSFNASETNLVNFLYNLGMRSSLIRVGSMQLARDPTGTRLQCSITFVGSYQKKPPPKITAVGSTAAKPATSAPPAKAAATPKTNAPPKAAAPTPAKATPSTAPPATKPGALRPAEKAKK
jgi:hypothetical protein